MDEYTVPGCMTVVSGVFGMIFSIPGLLMMGFAGLCLVIWVLANGV